MATLRPFRGFRPAPEHAARVASRPYDVLSTEEARAEAAGNSFSFLHVGKPEIDLPPTIDPHDKSVYEKGRENLQRFLQKGMLKEDPAACLYLYAQTMNDHTQYGLVGCAAVEEYRNNTIKKHELTRLDKEDDRTKHILATNAHTGPVFLTYRAHPTLDTIVEGIRTDKPLFDFTADDSVRHQLWVIQNETLIRSIVTTIERVASLYIADGHHRCAAATRAATERASANRYHTGVEEYNFFLAVLFPHNQVRIMDYNRAVRDLNGRTTGQFLHELRKYVVVQSERAPVRPASKGEFGMYLGNSWYRLMCKRELLENPDPVGRLDVSLLQTQILAPIFDIEDQRTDTRIDFIGGIRGLSELERRVDGGEMAVAFSLYPTSIEELLAVADAGKIMPPKSTWFEPKLRDGVVVHLLS